MKISFCPVSAPGVDLPRVAVYGDVLKINDKSYDFSPLPDGASVPRQAVASFFIVGDVFRDFGEIAVTLRLPVGESSTAAARYPAPIHVTQAGPVELPA